MKIANISKNTVLCQDCRLADSFLTRFIGLQGKKHLPEGSGLLIVPCNSIHMFFMNFPIDAVFIDGSNTVIHAIENIRPWRVSPIIPAARSVLELPVGTIRLSGTEIGDGLRIEN